MITSARHAGALHCHRVALAILWSNRSANCSTLWRASIHPQDNISATVQAPAKRHFRERKKPCTIYYGNDIINLTTVWRQNIDSSDEHKKALCRNSPRREKNRASSAVSSGKRFFSHSRFSCVTSGRENLTDAPSVYRLTATKKSPSEAKVNAHLINSHNQFTTMTV